MLFVDCQNRSSLDFLDPRGPIDINGDISVSKLGDSRETVPVSIQIVYKHSHSTPHQVCFNR